MNKKPPEFVYIVKSTEVYKIGCTRDFLYRIKELQCGNPAKIDIYAVYDFSEAKFNGGYFEKRLHSIYKNFRVSGEWFSLSSNHLLEIDLYCVKNGGVKIR